jgi:hypothetical protein
MSAIPKFHRCWTEAAIERYFTTEAMSKDEAAFMRVHLPIDKISVDESFNAFHGLGGTDYTGEESLKDLILKSHPAQANRIFSIVGETGSGKSELCQWLYYRIQDGVHVPILIRRSMIRLRDIVAEISQHLNEPVPDEVREITDLWEEAVSSQLVASIFMHMQRPEVLNQIGNQDAYRLRQLVDTPDFELRMRQNFIEYRDEVKRLDRARELNLLPEEDFRDMVFKSGGLDNPYGCYRHLQRAITDCLASTLKVEDLIIKLKRISDAFKTAGRRPVLLIEDVTTFGFLQNDLLDYLFDLGSGNYDVVIGITTGFEKANEQQIYKAQQTIRERIEGRFVLTDEHNETLFLRDNYEMLAALYLKAIKDNGCSICNSDMRFSEAFGQDLYPFSKQFLDNVYSNLQQDGNRKQTPRLYLRALRHILLAEGMRPFESVEILNIISPPTVWFAQSSAYSSDLEKLLQWYGHSYNDGVYLSRQIAGVFGVSVPTGIAVVEGYYRFNLRPGAEKSLPKSRFAIAGKSGPSIAKVEPGEGLPNVPNALRVGGANFQEGCVAYLGKTALATIRISATQLRIAVPADLPIGTYNLTVTNPDGNSASHLNAYTVKEPASPSITKTQPNEGDTGQPNDFFIEGENFQPACAVRLGDTTLSATRISPTRLRATVPADIRTGTYDLTITNPDGKSATRNNAYTAKATDLFGQLDDWLNRQGKFPGRAQFKEGVWKLLGQFQIDPFVLQHPHSIAKNGTPIIYSRGDKNSQIYLHDSADSLQVGYLKLTIHPDKRLRDLYSQVLAVGLGDYDVTDASKLDHPLLYDWLRGCVDGLRQEMRIGLTSALNMPLEQFIVLTKFLLLNNTTGLWEFTPETLAQPISGKPFALTSMGNRPQQLFEWRQDIQALFVSFFHLRDSLVNYPYLSGMMAKCDPLRSLSALRTIESEQVYDAYKIGSAKEAYSLRGLAKTISLYARDLWALQQDHQFIVSPSPEKLQTFADLCTSSEGIDLERLRTQLDGLRRLCSSVDLNWQRRWDLGLDPLHRDGDQLDFAAFAERATTLLSRLAQTHLQKNAFVYLALQRDAQAVATTTEYQVLDTICSIDQSISQALLIRSEHQVERDKRYQEFELVMRAYLRKAKP